jgi:hypothetical protein
MIDVFLSYRRESGAEFCSLLQYFLKLEGYEVFFDRNLEQGAYDDQLVKAITECTYLLVLLAPHDLDRCVSDPENDWILREIALARKYGKIVIPVPFRPGFSFPADTGNDTLEYLSRQEMCDISGPDAVDLIRTKLTRFMKNSPVVKQREEFFTGITQKEYLAWEIETLSNIYHDCPLVDEFGHKHPVVAFEGSDEVVFPFSALNQPENLLEKTAELDFRNTPYYHDFQRIIGPNIHYPDLYGFTNVGMLFDAKGRVNGFRAQPRTYKETVYTGHILHYELWRTYRELQGKRPAVLDDMPIRKSIHQGHSNRDVLISGCNRSSLCDVCIAVVAYDEDDDCYNLAIATRSANVTCYPGYLSFVPAGGFELFELERNQDDDNVRKNFQMLSALYREYIEELFGDEEFEKPTGDDDLRRLKKNDYVKALRKNIGKSYFFEFLGVALDVVSLRPTFSFILRIDDTAFMNDYQIRKNQENINIRFEPIADFDAFVRRKETDDPASPIMPESAGIYHMLKNNHLYREALQH